MKEMLIEEKLNEWVETFALYKIDLI